MYVGILNVRWGKLRRAHTLAICGDDRKPVAWARFWVENEETIIAIKPMGSTVIKKIEGDLPEIPSWIEEARKYCLKCGGPLELRLFVRCLNADGTPSIHDTSKEPYCPRCGLFWESCGPFYPEFLEEAT